MTLIANGKTVAQAARQIGAPAGTVATWARRAGHRPPPRRRFTEAQRQHALALLESGATLAQAGAAVAPPT